MIFDLTELATKTEAETGIDTPGSII